MSGNVKLACNLLDYTKSTYNGSPVYETEVRYAKLLPLSSSLYQRKIEAQLLGSSWEYDLKKFYDIYNDTFFDSYFSINETEILKIDKTVKQDVRNTDFETGVKRISYSKTGMQFGFFAPIYIESADDLPSAFIIDINIHTTVHSLTKRVKVNITDNKDSKKNFLFHYLNNYASKLDTNVCFLLPNSKQAAYWGIDLLHGGFVKCVDNGIANVYSVQTTINNFDATVCCGFKRNQIAMKQVLPLCYYLDVRQLMTESELKIYRNAYIEFSGYYVSQKGLSVPWYDFNIDYDTWKEKILKLNTDNGVMGWYTGYTNNIMDVSFPSLNECRYIEYQFSNKMTANYCRWKLKYSSDEHPYITNISPAFSKNQNSNYKYGQYPVSFSSMDGLALPMETDAYYYNLIFPLSTNVHYYDLYNSASTAKYQNIMNNYCLNWFNVITSIDDSLFSRTDYWQDVVDDCVYYNGILYDLSNIYSELVDPEKIDKFGMFVKVNTNFMSQQDIAKLKFSEYTLDRQVVTRNMSPNAAANLQLLNWSIGNPELNYKNFMFKNEEYSENQSRANEDTISFNKIFTYSETNTGNYINFADYAMDYYELNKYFEYEPVAAYINDLRKNFFSEHTTDLSMSYKDTWNTSFSNIIEANMFGYMPVFSNPSSYTIHSYELLPIKRSYDVSYFDGVYDASERYNYENSYGYSYILNLNQYQAYQYDSGLGDSYFGYYYTHIEQHPEEKQYLEDNLYIANIDDYGVKRPSYTSYYNSYLNSTISYFKAGKVEYSQTLNGNSFYTKKNFIKSSYLNVLAYEAFQPTYLKTFCNSSNFQDIYSFSNVQEPGTTTYNLWKSCQHVQEIAADLIFAYLDTQTKYDFNPVIQNNGTIYTSNVFTSRYKNIGRFYGSVLTYSQLSQDKDVLYADRYNLNAIFKKYTGLKTYTYTVTSGDNLYSTYTYDYHFTYDWIYNAEQNSYYPEYTAKYKIPPIYTYAYTDSSIEQVGIFNDNDYTELYAKFLNKQHIYYWYGELAKDETLQYKDNWPIDWKANIFIKRRVLAHTDEGLKVQDEFIPLVKAGYQFFNKVDQEWFLSFKKFYAHINESEEGLFYFDKAESEKFELVYKDIFFRVNKTLWDIIGCENPGFYKDIYIYRLEQPEEYDDYVTNDLHIRYISNKDWSSYSNRYSDVDNVLTPLFYDIFEREGSEEAILANYQLHNVSSLEYTYPVYDSAGHVLKYVIDNNYRYDANDTLYMVNVTDEEREDLGLTKTYDEYSYCNSGFNVEKNDLDFNDSLYMSTYKDANGTNYGFYVIEANIDNTSDTFRIDAQTSLTSKSLTDEKYEYLNNIKSIFYMNGVDITANPQYAVSLFKNIAPFTNLNLLGNLNHISTVIKPNSLSISMIYRQQLVDNTNESTEINIYKDEDQNYTNHSLFRYTHNIVPYITERSILQNYYYLKLKNVKKTILDDARYNSIGDSVLYKRTVQTEKFTPYNVYTLSENEKEVKSYNNVDYQYTPLEYKHFLASRFINLEPSITINLDGKHTYDELLSLQTDDHVLGVFRDYMNVGRVTKFSDDDIQYLFNMYDVKFVSSSAGLNVTKTEKVYTLTYKFELL